MRLVSVLAVWAIISSAAALDLDEFIDRLDNNLLFAPADSDFKARLSGRFDLEFYHFNQPPPGLIDTDGNSLFNPRLTLFLDGQVGSKISFFSQARIDRGFDPGDHGAQIRMDEYTIRMTPWEDGRLNFQAGKFATVIGNWVPRHLSWENPFVNAPLPYENVTPVDDKQAPRSAHEFVRGFQPAEKYDYIPIIWGPNYTSGVSLSGKTDPFDYAAEIKNSSLSSRPESWNITTNGFDRPWADGRIGYRPDQMWNFGFSAGEGAYFGKEAEKSLPHGRDLGDYREILLGQDASFAWHHLQIWAEFFETRFEVPRTGDVDTFSYYLEAKYKFSTQFFGAIRWNQQLFDTVNLSGREVRTAPNLNRIDLAGGYRFNAHTQLKLQYSFQQAASPYENNHLVAMQLTVRF